MNRLDYLYTFTKSEVTVKDKKQVTLAFGGEATDKEVILSLFDYFGRHGQQEAVRLVVGGQERGYLLRAALESLFPLGGVGDADGATVPGDPFTVTLTELFCPTAGCTQVLVVTRYDENDPPTCDAHGTAMELFK